MDGGRVHPLAKPYVLLSATCDEILSWMIEIRMEKPLGKCQILPHYIIPPKGMKNNVGLTFSVGDTTPRVTISIEQDN